VVPDVNRNTHLVLPSRFCPIFLMEIHVIPLKVTLVLCATYFSQVRLSYDVAVYCRWYRCFYATSDVENNKKLPQLKKIKFQKPKIGGGRPPPFWPRGTPYGQPGVAEPPRALVVRPPPRANAPFVCFFFFSFGLLGLAEPTPRLNEGSRATPKANGDGFGHPHFASWGWPNHPLASHRGWLEPPLGQNGSGRPLPNFGS
jgi:hypothetical protein